MNRYSKSMTVVVLGGVLVGCFRSSDDAPALDDESLRLLTISEKDLPLLEKTHERMSCRLSEGQADRLVSLLRPLKSVKVGELPPDMVHYKLSFQPSRDPMEFLISIADDQLVYSERQFLYEGGNAKEFKELAESIISAN